MRFLLALAFATLAQAQPTAYVGGQWFDGEQFVPRDTVWSDGGLFVPGPLAEADRVVDLTSQYIVPPYGDAHTHMLSDAYQGPRQAELFEREGVFYVLVLTNLYSWAADVMERFDGPESIDVAYSHGGWTSPRSHPVQVYEWQKLGFVGQQLTPAMRRQMHESRLAEDDAYFEAPTLADVEAKWPTFLSHQPDIVKVYVMDSGDAFGPPTSGFTGLPIGRGLSPEVLHDVVRRSHEAGLRVFAHVETGADVALAVAAGIDGFAHMPGYGYGAGIDAPYEIDPVTLATSGERELVYVPTSVVGRGYNQDRPARAALSRDLHRRQLRALHAAGARVAIGADRWNETSKAEADYMERHGFFDRSTLLDLWTRVTPQAVFPDRAIGQLADDFEASLLALACDPLADWSCTGQITHREKQGLDLDADDDMLATAIAWGRLDIATFTAPIALTDDALLRGLKYLADANFDAARTALHRALEVAPDSLHSFVHRRLAEVAAEQFDWAEVVHQRTEAGDDVAGGVLAGFARFPATRVRFDEPQASVPFDGLRATVQVNGETVEAVVDTGAPGTGIPRGLAERLGLRVDTTAQGVSRVPSMNLEFNTYAVLIDSVTVGGATFTNVPATVGGPETSADGDVFLGANLFRRFAASIRYDYADSTFTITRDIDQTDERPTFLIDGGSAPVVPVAIAGQAANAIVDTGNQRAVYLAQGAFDLADQSISRTLSGDGWSVDLYDLPFEIPGHPDGLHEAYEATFLFSADDAITAVLGRPIWSDGALVLDFVNRRVRFEASAHDSASAR